MDKGTKVLAIALLAIMLIIPVLIMMVGLSVAIEGIDELNTLLAAYSGLADAIVKVSGGFTVALLGCMGALFYLMVLRSPDHPKRVENRVEDTDDIED